MNKIRVAVSISWLFVTVLLLFSCTNKSTQRFDQLSKAASKDDYLGIIQTIKKKPELYGKLNRFLYYMDIGTLFHYALLHDSSNLYLDKAAQIHQELFTKSITNEASALLTNDNIRPYRSKPYEMIFLHQLMAFNFLAHNDYEACLVESRRTQLLIDEWQRKDKKGIKYTSDGLFHYTAALAYREIGEPDNASISLFKSIQAYQQGIVSLPTHVNDLAYYTFSQNDRDNDIQLLELQPQHQEKEIIGLKENETEVILIGYAGRGPILGENMWWGTWVRDGLLVVHYKTADGKQETMTMPAPEIPKEEIKKGKKTKSGTTLHLKFAMPDIKIFPAKSSYFSVRSTSLTNPITSTKVNDLDKLAEKYLSDNRKKTILRTVIRVLTRTVAAEKTKKELSTDNPLVNLLTNIGTDILADQLEKADTRTCFLIPKTIHLARIPVNPGTHTFDIAVHNHSGSVIGSRLFENITLKSGQKKFIFYPALY